MADKAQKDLKAKKKEVLAELRKEALQNPAILERIQEYREIEDAKKADKEAEHKAKQDRIWNGDGGHDRGLNGRIKDMLTGVAGYDLNWYIMIGKLCSFGQELGKADLIPFTWILGMAKNAAIQAKRATIGDSVTDALVKPKLNIKGDFNPTVDDSGIVDFTTALKDAKNMHGKELSQPHQDIVGIATGLWFRDKGYDVIFNDNNSIRITKESIPISKNQFQNLIESEDFQKLVEDKYEIALNPKILGTEPAIPPTPPTP